MLERLLGGLPDVTIERDARLQEFGDRFTVAEATGKVNDRAWWLGYKREVEAFALQYGYSFGSHAEGWDLASWRSWVEDTQSLFRIVAASAGQDNRPTLVTMHSAAQNRAREAAREAAKMLSRAPRSMRALPGLSRQLAVARARAERVFALASTAVRLVVMEMGGRLVEAGALAESADIFHLTPEELLALPGRLREDGRAEIALEVTRRKHDLWLEGRLSAPAVLDRRLKTQG